MISSTNITSEDDLAIAIRQAGYTPARIDTAPSRIFWQSEWHSKTVPLACYIEDFTNDDVYVAIDDQGIAVYIQDRQDYWFHKIGELHDHCTVAELTQLIRSAVAL